MLAVWLAVPPTKASNRSTHSRLKMWFLELSQTLANFWGLPKDRITSCQSKNSPDSVNSPRFWEIRKMWIEIEVVRYLERPSETMKLGPVGATSAAGGCGSFSSCVSLCLRLLSQNTHCPAVGRPIKSHFFIGAHCTPRVRTQLLCSAAHTKLAK